MRFLLRCQLNRSSVYGSPCFIRKRAESRKNKLFSLIYIHRCTHFLNTIQQYYAKRVLQYQFNFIASEKLIKHILFYQIMKKNFVLLTDLMSLYFVSTIINHRHGYTSRVELPPFILHKNRVVLRHSLRSYALGRYLR